MTETTKRTTKSMGTQGCQRIQTNGEHLEAFELAIRQGADEQLKWMYKGLPQTANSSLCTTKT